MSATAEAAVNTGLELGLDHGGAIVVISAYCVTCREQAGVNDRDGTCNWCRTKIVDEDELPAREILERLNRLPAGAATVRYPFAERLAEAPPAEGDDREPPAAATVDGDAANPSTALEETPPDVDDDPVDDQAEASLEAHTPEPPRAGDVSSSATQPDDRRPAMTDTTAADKAAILDEIRRVHAATGTVPVGAHFKSADRPDGVPHLSKVMRLFGNYGNAVVEAGFERPTRGGNGGQRRHPAPAPAALEHTPPPELGSDVLSLLDKIALLDDGSIEVYSYGTRTRELEGDYRQRLRAALSDYGPDAIAEAILGRIDEAKVA